MKYNEIVVTFVLMWCSYLNCQDNFFVIKENSTDGYSYKCATNSSFALSWITKSILPNKNERVSYFTPERGPNLFDYKINTSDKKNRMYFSNPNNWTLKRSVHENHNTLILDRRWEDMKTYKTEYVNKNREKLKFVTFSTGLKNNFEIPLSICIKKEAHIFLCDGEKPNTSNCYWLLLQYWNQTANTLASGMRKCKKSEIPHLNNIYPTGECNTPSIVKNHPPFTPYLYAEKWNHFILKKQKNRITFIQSHHHNDFKIILDYEDKIGKINVTYMIVHSKHVNGLWKIHNLEYIYTNREINNAKLGPSINGTDDVVCISMFVSMCLLCKLKLTLLDSNNATLGEKIFTQESSGWNEIKFITENATNKSVNLFVSTYGKSQDKFWAIDDVRLCLKQELRMISVDAKHKVLACQSMSNENNIILIKKDGVHNTITDLLVTSKSEDSISLRWKQPKQALIEYYINYQYKEDENKKWKSIIVKSSNTSCKLWPDFHCIKLTDLVKGKHYYIQIIARSQKRENFGYLTFIENTTEIEQSEAPYDLKGYWTLDNNLHLEWKHPNATNEKIKCFNISVNPPSELSGKRIDHFLVLTENSYNLTYYYKVTAKDILPSTNYKITIFACNDQDGKYVSETYFSPPGIPQAMNTPNISCLENTTIILEISLKRPDETENGNIFELFIIIPSVRGDLKSFTQLQKLENKLNFSTNKVFRTEKITDFKRPHLYFIKNSSSVVQNSSPHDVPSVITVVITNTDGNGTSLKIYTLPVHCSTSNNQVFFALLLLLLIPLVVLIIRKKLGLCKNSKAHIQDKICLKEVYSKVIQQTHFENYLKESLVNDELKRQHEMVLNNIEILTFGKLQYDYVNMEYNINDEISSKNYIITEVPKPKEMVDFWKTIWEENIQYIIYIEIIPDNVKKTTEKYWPEENEKVNYQDISVELAFKTFTKYWESRTFILICDKVKKQVNQYYLKMWCNHGVPLHSSNITRFFQMFLEDSLKTKSPILVHSSNGNEATGFILLCDMSLSMMKKSGAVDMLKNLQRLGNHNVNLIENFSYYKLAHLIVLEYFYGTESVEQLINFYKVL